MRVLVLAGWFLVAACAAPVSEPAEPPVRALRLGPPEIVLPMPDGAVRADSRVLDLPGGRVVVSTFWGLPGAAIVPTQRDGIPRGEAILVPGAPYTYVVVDRWLWMLSSAGTHVLDGDTLALSTLAIESPEEVLWTGEVALARGSDQLAVTTGAGESIRTLASPCSPTFAVPATDGATLVRCGGMRGGLFAVDRSGELFVSNAVDSLDTIACSCGPSCWVLTGADRRVVYATRDGLSFVPEDGICSVAPAMDETVVVGAVVVGAPSGMAGFALGHADGPSVWLPLVSDLSARAASVSPLDEDHRLLVYAGIDSEAGSDAPAVYARVVELVR